MSNHPKTKAEAIAYQFDFDGACIPKDGCKPMHRTFSVGIFQWVPKTSGNGLKRGRTLMRIKGNTGNSEKVLARAEKLCADFQKNYGYNFFNHTKSWSPLGQAAYHPNGPGVARRIARSRLTGRTAKTR